LAVSKWQGKNFNIALWDLEAVQRGHDLVGQTSYSTSIALSDDGRFVAAGCNDKRFRVWDAQTGQLLRTSDEQEGRVISIAFSHDGMVLLSGAGESDGARLKIWEATSLKLVRAISIEGDENSIRGAIFSPDNRSVIARDVILRDIRSGNAKGSYKSDVPTYTVAFSPDGQRFASGNHAQQLTIFDRASGRTLQVFNHPGSVHHAVVQHVVFSPDGAFVISVLRRTAVSSGDTNLDDTNTIKLWDTRGGHLVKDFVGASSEVVALAFSGDGRRIVAACIDGTFRVWDLTSGALLVSTFTSQTGDWVTITPEGFFAASDGGLELLNVVRGLQVYSIDQFYQSLYRPDLVRAKLAGNSDRVVQEAAMHLDLDKVMASGSVPSVRILSPRDVINQTTDDIIIQAEIADRGGGIGRVEWRVNRLTVGIENPASASAGQPVRVIRSVTLEEGTNHVDVVAYNKANLAVSRAARTVVVRRSQRSDSATAVSVRLRLFVITAGVDRYADARFELKNAVADAETVGRALAEAGKGYYQSVDIRILRNGDVISERLEKEFQEVAARIGPEDVFVLYIASHGKTVDGRYYSAPATFKVSGALSDDAINSSIVAGGIDQEQWQSWFARIPARRSVILFDTCESGTLAEDKAELKTLERAAATDRLARSTGRSIITATSNKMVAFEGYRGHGLFTYVVLDAIERGDGDGNGLIEVVELAAFVYAQVTSLSEKVFSERQEPQMRLVRNYPLVRQALVLRDKTTPRISRARQEYRLQQTASLRIKPGGASTVVRSLSPNTAVTVLEAKDGWALVGSGERPLGYVAISDLGTKQ
jgi:WD40 repeat protein/uncharacterized caspase-like protein